MRSVFLKSVRAFNLALFWSNKEIIHTNKQQNYEKRYKCTILTAETIKMVCCHVNALFEGKKKSANLITFIQPAMLRSPASTLYCILELLYQFLEWVSCTNCYNVPKIINIYLSNRKSPVTNHFWIQKRFIPDFCSVSIVININIMSIFIQ